MPDDPVIVRAEETTEYDVGPETEIAIRLTGAATGGALTVFEIAGDLVRDPSGARQHVHDDFTEVFYIVEGEVAFVSGDRDPVLGLGPGSLLFVPPGVPHGLAPNGRWRHVTFVLPGGFDRYFAEVAAAIARDGEAADRAAIAARYGTHPA